MASRTYRQMMLCACSTCGQEWFGHGGELTARKHAADTRHQVEVQYLHRETINPVAERAEPDYVPLVKLAPAVVQQSVAAARARVTLFDGPINQRVSM